MRGKGLRDEYPLGYFGITPAHAGKSGRLFDPGRPERDHPRACGEKSAAIICFARDTGSPPRMRGKVLTRN